MPETIEQSGTSISETREIAAPPKSADATATKIEVKVEADLLSEYVAASPTGPTPWNDLAYVKTLPNPSDDIMRDYGTRLYDQDMPRDPQVYSTLAILTMALHAQGFKMETPIKDSDDGYKQALEVLRFCNFCHANLRRSLPEILYELTEGMLKMGHKTGEMIYEQRTVNTFSGDKIVLVDVKTKEHEATAFVVDAFKNVLGLVYLKPGQSLPTFSSVPTDASGKKMPPMVPRSKFIIPTHKPRNGDPRGTSHIRAVYPAWWKKQMWNPQHVAYVTRFAQPSAIAKLPSDAKDIPVQNSNGTGTKMKSIVQATTEALAKIKGGAVGSFVNTDVFYLEAGGTGEVIFNSYDHEDRQIAKGILMQTLTTEEGQHMARAAGTIHQDVFGLLIAFLRYVVEWVWSHEVLKPLVRYNFGADAAERFTPTCSLGDSQVTDIPKLMGAISQLALAGVIHDSQYPAIRSMLGLPPADAAAEAKDQAIKDQQRQLGIDGQKAAAKAALTNPPQPGQPGQPPAPGAKPPAGAPGAKPPVSKAPVPGAKPPTAPNRPATGPKKP